MAEASWLTETELTFLGELTRRDVPFMIVGLAAATLQGAPVVTQDVDLWFKDLLHPGIEAALRLVGAVYVPPSLENPPMFAGARMEALDIVTLMHGLESFDRELAHTRRVTINDFEVPILNLARIIASKLALNREKDRIVLPVLQSALKALNHNPPVDH